MSIPWKLCNALATLRSALDIHYPTRDRRSDGAIGDVFHTSRNSDHNPWFRDVDGVGVVTALDVDRDISPTFCARDLVERIAGDRDARVKYLISNRQIMSGDTGPSPWKWRTYNGPNAHKEHAHISVKGGMENKKFWNANGPWWIGNAGTASLEPLAPRPEPRNVPNIVERPKIVRPALKMGDAGTDVEYLQRMLGGLTIDGDFGPRTRDKVKAFQARFKLPASDIVDAATWLQLEE